jgi:hypothetical protein
MVKNDETPIRQDEIWRTQIKSLEYPPGVRHFFFCLAYPIILCSVFRLPGNHKQLHSHNFKGCCESRRFGTPISLLNHLTND